MACTYPAATVEQFLTHKQCLLDKTGGVAQNSHIEKQSPPCEHEKMLAPLNP
jgi:hypothetical protein